jgi:hypothetical protein
VPSTNHQIDDRVTVQVPFTQGQAHVEPGKVGVVKAVYPNGMVDVDFEGDLKIPEFDEGYLTYPHITIPTSLLKNDSHEERQMADQMQQENDAKDNEGGDSKKEAILSAHFDDFVRQGSPGDFIRFAIARTAYRESDVEDFLRSYNPEAPRHLAAVGEDFHSGDRVKATTSHEMGVPVGTEGVILDEAGDLFERGNLWFDVKFDNGITVHMMDKEMTKTSAKTASVNEAEPEPFSFSNWTQEV